MSPPAAVGRGSSARKAEITSRTIVDAEIRLRWSIAAVEVAVS